MASGAVATAYTWPSKPSCQSKSSDGATLTAASASGIRKVERIAGRSCSSLRKDGHGAGRIVDREARGECDASTRRTVSNHAAVVERRACRRGLKDRKM